MPTKSRYLACISQPVHDCAAHTCKGRLLPGAPVIGGRKPTSPTRSACHRRSLARTGLTGYGDSEILLPGLKKLYGIIGVAGHVHR